MIQGLCSVLSFIILLKVDHMWCDTYIWSLRLWCLRSFRSVDIFLRLRFSHSIHHDTFLWVSMKVRPETRTWGQEDYRGNDPRTDMKKWEEWNTTWGCSIEGIAIGNWGLILLRLDETCPECSWGQEAGTSIQCSYTLLPEDPRGCKLSCSSGGTVPVLSWMGTCNIREDPELKTERHADYVWGAMQWEGLVWAFTYCLFQDPKIRQPYDMGYLRSQ